MATIAREEAELLTTLKERVAGRGVAVEEISVGATPTARFSAQLPGITELRPGNYIYYDRMQVTLGSATWDDCALTVLARVVSRPSADRLDPRRGQQDADERPGARAPRGYGTVLRSLDSFVPDDSLLIERLSEEHAVVRVQGQGSRLAPGDLVRIVPNHSCVVSNLVDEIWVVDGGEARDTLRVAARGRIA